jgi:hypothetical protein
VAHRLEAAFARGTNSTESKTPMFRAALAAVVLWCKSQHQASPTGGAPVIVPIGRAREICCKFGHTSRSPLWLWRLLVISLDGLEKW